MTLVTLVGVLSPNDVDKRFIILAFIPNYCFLVVGLVLFATGVSLHYIFILFVTNTASIYVFIKN